MHFKIQVVIIMSVWAQTNWPCWLYNYRDECSVLCYGYCQRSKENSNLHSTPYYSSYICCLGYIWMFLVIYCTGYKNYQRQFLESVPVISEFGDVV